MRILNERHREQLRNTIFRADTLSGKAFDVALIIAILTSVVVVAFSSLSSLSPAAYRFLGIIEWILTILFTIEYILRVYCLKHPRQYTLSFFGIVDLVSFLPSYFSYWFVGMNFLLVVRLLRLLRIFRIFRLRHMLHEGNALLLAIRRSVPKIFVFMLFVVVLVTILGSIMYVIEGAVNPTFTSIPRSIYWAIVTLTTVGYGDITPITPFGQILSTIVMLLGYAIIAVPTGIITAEMTYSTKPRVQKTPQTSCVGCGKMHHSSGAKYCSDCGEPLHRATKTLPE